MAIKQVKYLLILSFIAAGMITAHQNVESVQAQSPLWDPPVNLSQSRAASQPSIVSGLDANLQVFWMDRFDGLVTSYFDGNTWSQALPVPVNSKPFIKPFIISETSGWVHAFWTETNNQNPLWAPLYHSQMLLGGAAWSEPELLAEDAMTFAVEPVID